MHFLILLQHLDKPAEVAITQNSGNGVSMQGITMSIVTAIATFLVTKLIVKPSEKVEAFEQAKVQSITDNLNEFKLTYRQNATEWHVWRDAMSSRVTTLELQHKALQEALGDKIKDLTEDVSETKEITQDIREALAGLKVQMEQTIAKWSR